MSETKTVSLRVEIGDLAVVEQAGLRPVDVMRDALRTKAAELRARGWAEDVRRRRWTPAAGLPPSEEMVRRDRDAR